MAYDSLSPDEQREMYEMVKTTYELTVGVKDKDGEVLLPGLVTRVHRLEKWRGSLMVQIALVSGSVVTIVWFIEHFLSKN